MSTAHDTFYFSSFISAYILWLNQLTFQPRKVSAIFNLSHYNFLFILNSILILNKQEDSNLVLICYIFVENRYYLKFNIIHLIYILEKQILITCFL